MQMLVRTIGYGSILYALMYLAWALLATYGTAGSIGARVTLFAVLVVSTYLAARSLGYHSARDIFPFSLSWVAVIAAYDALFAAPTGAWQTFADPNLWVAYLLVLFVPLVLSRPPTYAHPTMS